LAPETGRRPDSGDRAVTVRRETIDAGRSSTRSSTRSSAAKAACAWTTCGSMRTPRA